MMSLPPRFSSPVSGHSNPWGRSFKSLSGDVRRPDFSGTPRKCGKRPTLWGFSQTGQTGPVTAPAAASPSFVAGVLPQALDDLV